MLEITYEKMDLIPKGFETLYEDRDGVAHIVGINGMKTGQDVANVQEALRKERENHAVVKSSLTLWGDLKVEDVRASLDRIPELELAAKGKLDEAAIDEIVNTRMVQKIAPLERQIEGIAKERDEWKEKSTTQEKSILTRDRNDAVRVIATEMKVHATAMPDIEAASANYLERTEEGIFIVKADIKGLTPGLDIKGYLKEMQKTRPHWWPTSEGGGAGGAGGTVDGVTNPWKPETWNMTQQGAVLKDQGVAVAESMAKSAGTTVGGLKPRVKAA